MVTHKKINFSKMELINGMSNSTSLKNLNLDYDYAVSGYAMTEKEDGTLVLFMKLSNEEEKDLLVATTSATVIDGFTFVTEDIETDEDLEKMELTVHFHENKGKRTFYTIEVVGMNLSK